MSRGWIGVDLDATLAEYHGWIDEHHVGEPISPMVERVRGWLAAGQEVRIFTARVGPSLPGMPERDLGAIAKTIGDWCEKHLGQRLDVTATKDYAMVALYDDRAFHVAPNEGTVLEASGETVAAAPSVDPIVRTN